MSVDIFSSFVGEKYTPDDAAAKSVFSAFDQNVDGVLDANELQELLAQLFRKSDGTSYPLTPQQVQDFKYALDLDQDGVISFDEFKLAWRYWFGQILAPKSAFLIIDVQNDFISGSLSLTNCPSKQDGAEVIPVINYVLTNVHFDMVVYSLDWHPSDHISFIDNLSTIYKAHLHPSNKEALAAVKVLDEVEFDWPTVDSHLPKVQTMWPRHCVQNSWGSELHKDLKVLSGTGSATVVKGTDSRIDSYSAFWDNGKVRATELHNILAQKGITDVYCCGLATDVCVKATAIDACQHGFRTTMVIDACRGVNDDNILAAQKLVQDAGGVVVTSDSLLNMVAALDRHPEHGYISAFNQAEAIKNYVATQSSK